MRNENQINYSIKAINQNKMCENAFNIVKLMTSISLALYKAIIVIIVHSLLW